MKHVDISWGGPHCDVHHDINNFTITSRFHAQKVVVHNTGLTIVDLPEGVSLEILFLSTRSSAYPPSVTGQQQYHIGSWGGGRGGGGREGGREGGRKGREREGGREGREGKGVGGGWEEGRGREVRRRRGEREGRDAHKMDAIWLSNLVLSCTVDQTKEQFIKKIADSSTL